MRPGLVAIVVAAVAVSVGCGAVHSFRMQQPGPRPDVLAGVRVSEFVEDACGAGSLATLLDYHGIPVTWSAVAAELPTMKDGTVLSVDLMLTARRFGFDARWAVGSADVIAGEIDARRPVIVLLQVVNLPGSGRDMFHYAVVDGVDAQRELYRIHLGDGHARWVKARALERAWKGTGHGTLIVEPRAEASLGPEIRLTRAVALEASGDPAGAVRAYGALLEGRPDWTRVWINMGNALAALDRTDAAETAFRTALDQDPSSVDALNNLAWLLLEERRDLTEAEQLARRAAASGGADDGRVLDTLARILVELDRCDEAERVFRRADRARGDRRTGLSARERREVLGRCASTSVR